MFTKETEITIDSLLPLIGNNENLEEELKEDLAKELKDDIEATIERRGYYTFSDFKAFAEYVYSEYFNEEIEC